MCAPMWLRVCVCAIFFLRSNQNWWHLETMDSGHHPNKTHFSAGLSFHLMPRPFFYALSSPLWLVSQASIEMPGSLRMVKCFWNVHRHTHTQPLNVSVRFCAIYSVTLIILQCPSALARYLSLYISLSFTQMSTPHKFEVEWSGWPANNYVFVLPRSLCSFCPFCVSPWSCAI